MRQCSISNVTQFIFRDHSRIRICLINISKIVALLPEVFSFPKQCMHLAFLLRCNQSWRLCNGFGVCGQKIPARVRFISLLFFYKNDIFSNLFTDSFNDLFTDLFSYLFSDLFNDLHSNVFRD